MDETVDLMVYILVILFLLGLLLWALQNLAMVGG